MKTLTALILALASLSTVYATEPESSKTVVVQLPIADHIALALADDPILAPGECKAVCKLPTSFD